MAKRKKLRPEDGYVTTIHPPGSANDVQREIDWPEFYRPEIHYWKAVVFFLAHFIVGYGIALLFAYFREDTFGAMSLFAAKWFFIPTLSLFVLTSRCTCIWCVRLYQRYAKPQVRMRCCMTPSCSEYAILAFKKYGTIIGGIKTIGRLKRCHPPGGVDYP